MKETLEEAAEKLTKDFPHYSVRNNMDDFEIKGWFLEALQKGAKWQAERMYSEEDMQESFVDCWKLNVPDGIECKVSFNEWFEQFKNK